MYQLHQAEAYQNQARERDRGEREREKERGRGEAYPIKSGNRMLTLVMESSFSWNPIPSWCHHHGAIIIARPSSWSYCHGASKERAQGVEDQERCIEREGEQNREIGRRESKEGEEGERCTLSVVAMEP